MWQNFSITERCWGNFSFISSFLAVIESAKSKPGETAALIRAKLGSENKEIYGKDMNSI